MTEAIFITKIVLASIMLLCSGFVIFVVLKQSGNSDGMEAMSGGSRSDDQDSYFNKNASSRKENKLKLLTYISAGLLAVCSLVFLILSAVVD